MAVGGETPPEFLLNESHTLRSLTCYLEQNEAHVQDILLWPLATRFSQNTSKRTRHTYDNKARAQTPRVTCACDRYDQGDPKMNKAKSKLEEWFVRDNMRARHWAIEGKYGG